MHYLAPLPIIIGVVGVIAGLLWLIAAGTDEDGGPNASTGGILHLGVVLLNALLRDPMSVLYAFGFLAVGAALIGLGIVML